MLVRHGTGVLGSSFGDEDATVLADQVSLHRPGEAIELGGSARYEIVRSLGKGGFAEVFLARRLGPDGFVREVALKCISAGMELDARTRRAFACEAQLASRLRHPNIAEAYELAELRGRYYLVLEYIEGVTAHAVLQLVRRERKRLSEGICCHVIANVADALHYAHGLTGADGKPLGIVHRDVTAVNVMIARSGAVKLLDFGIALARLQGRERTLTGELKGTYAYASPEQISNEPLDGRSDLFSLGVLLVEMLTGVRVFDAGGHAATIRKVDECNPADVRAALPNVPDDLAGICERALARKRADRFQDGAQFSTALRAVLAKRGCTYWPSDCASELEALGAFEADSREEAVEHGAGSASVAAKGPLSAVARSSGSRRQLRAGTRRWRTGLAVAVAAIAVVSGAAVFRKGGLQSMTAAKPASAAVPAVERPGPEMSTPHAAPTAMAAVPAAALVDEAVVRPKRPSDKEKVERNRRAVAARTDRPATRLSGAMRFADRPDVASSTDTLPKRTLIPVKLVRPIAVAEPGEAQAVVTEDVVNEGGLLVPKGSTVACISRRRTDERVPLSCDRVKTADRQLVFEGVAVGEGHRIGLRARDSEIAAGTPFVVYVSASAAVR